MVFLYVLLAAIAAVIIVLLLNTWLRGLKAAPLKASDRVYDKNKEELYGNGLGELLKCKTVSYRDSYDDTEFKKFREKVRELFPAIHARAELKIFGESCLVYKIPGRDEDRNIVLMSHHDVVPPEGEWKYDPFCGEVHDGKVWGRGAADTKGSLYAELQAVEELLEEGFVPPCNLYIISSHNEETTGKGVSAAREYFEKEGIRFELVMDEGGAIIDPPLAGMKCEKCVMVAVHEKGRYYMDCTAEPARGHTNLNGGISGTERMAKFIAESTGKGVYIRRLHPQLRAMFEHLSPYCGFGMRMLFSNLWLFGPVIVKVLPSLNGAAGSMLGTTCTFSKINCEGNGKDCTARALLRDVDAKDFETDLEAFKKLAKKYDVKVEFGEGCEDYIPADMGLKQFAYVKECVKDIFPAYPMAPYVLPAGTDARLLTQLCDCVLRFAPLSFSKQQFNAIHNPDENVDVRAVYDAVLFYKRLVKGYK